MGRCARGGPQRRVASGLSPRSTGLDIRSKCICVFAQYYCCSYLLRRRERVLVPQSEYIENGPKEARQPRDDGES